jgi:hypothetical protein
MSFTAFKNNTCEFISARAPLVSSPNALDIATYARCSVNNEDPDNIRQGLSTAETFTADPVTIA